MFICATCKKVIGPKIKPIVEHTGYKMVEYKNTKIVQVNDFISKEVEVDSTGFEILGEKKLCETCAGTPAPVEIQNRVTVIGRVYQEKLPEPMRIPLATVAIYNALDRVNRKSKRAQADINVAIPMFKDFVDRNPGVAV